MTAPVILVFDSGLGGLTVLREIRAARPDARLIYLADTAAFPYGALREAEIIRRVVALIGQSIADHAPDVAVIACNTASTLVLPHLRSVFAIPFVGTVPAIKPAAQATRSGMVGVLATPGTVKRDYTRALIDTYAYHLDVTLVPSASLAGLAESALRGEQVDEAAVAAEIAPAFEMRGDRRTDTVVLGCTHYPLLRDELERLAPWPVNWIDPAPAIARRTRVLLGQRGLAATAEPDRAFMTGDVADGDLAAALAAFGLVDVAPALLSLKEGEV